MSKSVPSDCIDMVLCSGWFPSLPAAHVAFAPGPCATFDGSRWTAAVVVAVSGVDRRDRHRFHRDDLSDAIALVEATASSSDPRVIVLQSRNHLRVIYGSRVDAIERRLAAVARRSGATFLAHSWEPPRPEDRDRYPVIVEDTGPTRRSARR